MREDQDFNPYLTDFYGLSPEVLELLRRIAASRGADGRTIMANMGVGRVAPQQQRDFRTHGEPLQNYGQGAPGESEWFRNLTPNMRRNFGHDWPSSPLEEFVPPPAAPDSRTPMHDPSQMPIWPWLYPRQRGRT